jgi:hypothetical protein
MVIQTSDDDLLINDLVTPDDAGEPTPMAYILTCKVVLGRDEI